MLCIALRNFAPVEIEILGGRCFATRAFEVNFLQREMSLFSPLRLDSARRVTRCLDKRKICQISVWKTVEDSACVPFLHENASLFSASLAVNRCTPAMPHLSPHRTQFNLGISFTEFIQSMASTVSSAGYNWNNVQFIGHKGQKQGLH